MGAPEVAEMHFEIHPWEFDLVESSMRDGRAHDVTMFIRSMDDLCRIAVIRKPFFPKEAYRAPSGAAKPGERLEDAAIRESLEETGLDVELVRYLARINADFTNGDRLINWISHVFEAVQLGGVLAPIDLGEIDEARWATVDELKTNLRRTLLDAKWDLFRYRVALTDLAVKRMEDS